MLALVYWIFLTRFVGNIGYFVPAIREMHEIIFVFQSACINTIREAVWKYLLQGSPREVNPMFSQSFSLKFIA